MRTSCEPISATFAWQTPVFTADPQSHQVIDGFQTSGAVGAMRAGGGSGGVADLLLALTASACPNTATTSAGINPMRPLADGDV